MKQTKSIKFVISLIILMFFMICGRLYADPAVCHLLQTSSTGNNGSLTFSCESNVDLTLQTINFMTSGGIVSSAWTGPNTPSGKFSISQTGGVNVISVSQWYPQGADYILPANTNFQLEFTNSTANFNITDFSIGNNPSGPQGSVQFIQNDGSQTIPDSAVISLLPQTSTGKTYSWTWSQVQSPVVVNSGSYQVTAYFLDKSGNKVQIQANPSQIMVATNATQKVGLTYQAPAPAQSYPAYVTVSGLPQNTTTVLHFIATSGSGNKYDFTAGNGKNSTAYNIIADNYTLSADALTVDDQRYSVSPQTISVDSGANNFSVNFSPAPALMSVMPYKDMGMNMHWDVTPTRSNIQDLAKASNHYGFVFAFVVSNGSTCTPIWGGNGLPINSFVQDAQFLKNNQGNVAISFGGEDAADLENVCSIDQLVNIFNNVYQLYQPDYLDFDIEGSQVTNTKKLSILFSALHIFQQTNPSAMISLTLPANIGGMDNNGIAVVQLAKDNGLNVRFFNLMTMAWGSQKLPGKPISDDVAAAVAAANDELNKIFDPIKIPLSQIRVTPKIGIDYDGSELNTADAQNIGKFVKDMGLAGLSYWSMDEDWNNNSPNGCKIGAVNPDCSGVAQAPFDFLKQFEAGLSSNNLLNAK